MKEQFFAGAQRPLTKFRTLAVWRLVLLLHRQLRFGDSNVAMAQTVTRGPYLQLGTSTSIVIRWRTSVATNSRVRYGASPTSLTNTVDLPAVTTEHDRDAHGSHARYSLLLFHRQHYAGPRRRRPSPAAIVIFLLPRRRPGWRSRRVSGSSAIPATRASTGRVESSGGAQRISQFYRHAPYRSVVDVGGQCL